MKKLFLLFVLMVLVLIGAAAQSAAEISFTYARQSGSASNQFAVWIEDTNGQLIKTLYVTKWTASNGYKTRPTSIPLWIKKTNRAEMTVSQVDAVSGATPRAGTLSYTWDGTNSRGAAVPAGDYILVLEGTLRWENQVYYRAPIALGKGSASAKVSVEYVSGERDTTAERAMFSDVKVRTLR